MVCNVITADKANRLFWVGRYAERVYISLHLLRRYYDSVIDGHISALSEYYSLLGVDCSAHDTNSVECQLAQLYDRDNICSITSTLQLTGDNAVYLRGDITSESLSYIHLSQTILEECEQTNEMNITKLQLITDYMLSFFGSVDERIFDKRIRLYLKMGRLIENLDLHIRFNYEYFRIEEAYMTLRDLVTKYDGVADGAVLEELDSMIDEVNYCHTEAYKSRLLTLINTLVLV